MKSQRLNLAALSETGVGRPPLDGLRRNNSAHLHRLSNGRGFVATACAHNSRLHGGAHRANARENRRARLPILFLSPIARDKTVSFAAWF